MRRILFVIKNLSLRGGGAERVLAQLTSALAERGHDIAVASFQQIDAPDFYQGSDQVRRINLGLVNREGALSPTQFLSASIGLRRLLAAERPDIAIGFMYSAYVPLGLAAWRTGVPVIASEHAGYPYYDGQGLRRYFLPLGIKLGTVATIPSRAARDSFPPDLARHMRVLANPVDLAPLERCHQPGRPKRILSVGRLRPEKNHAILIEAFHRVAANYPDWELALVGDGEMHASLEQLSTRLGLKQRVRFVGSVEDVAACYATADVFVLPSLTESFAIAAAEAMLARLPVIAMSECAAVGELVSHEVNGLLVLPGDHVTQLAGSLERLMKDEPLRRRLGEAGPAALQPFSLSNIVERWEELIEDVLRNKSK